MPQSSIRIRIHAAPRTPGVEAEGLIERAHEAIAEIQVSRTGRKVCEHRPRPIGERLDADKDAARDKRRAQLIYAD
jgi:hypothetical protein